MSVRINSGLEEMFRLIYSILPPNAISLTDDHHASRWIFNTQELISSEAAHFLVRTVSSYSELNALPGQLVFIGLTSDL